jgi:orotate phosphoribosyltransferase-like protein
MRRSPEEHRRLVSGITALRNAGHTLRFIADELGVSSMVAWRVLRVESERGNKIPKVTPPKLVYGRINIAFRKLPTDIQEWVLTEKPADMTLVDFIMAFVTDAYHEEADQ